jgi:ubiquinone/menaquinone biosynthesis C-methylase UbiE
MFQRYRFTHALCLLFLAPAVSAAQRPAAVVRQEREQASREIPKLADVLSLKPGMTVADVGAGGGAMAVSMAKWLGPSGRVYATDVRDAQLTEIRDAVARDGLKNVVVLEGAARATNLPNECCDAIFLRDVYHHLTNPQAFDASLLAAVKPGGRIAIMDFEPEPGSKVPEGVPANRDGHGIRASMIVSELTQAGFRHVRTMSRWPGDIDRDMLYLVLFEKPSL